MTMAAAIDRQAQAEQAELVARAARGDQAALLEIANLYARPMYLLAWRLMFDADEARDTVREAFARLWTKANHWRKGDGRIGGWLYGMTTTSALSRLRRRDAAQLAAAPDGIAACLAAFPGRQRAAIVLTRCDALPNAEVAAILGLKPTALEDLLSDGGASLQACLKSQGLRTDLLDHQLEELRPPALPPTFADWVVAEAVGRAPASRRTMRRDRRGAWLREHRTVAGLIAANLLVAGSVATVLAADQGITSFQSAGLTTATQGQALSESEGSRSMTPDSQRTASIIVPLPAVPTLPKIMHLSVIPAPTAAGNTSPAPVRSSVEPATGISPEAPVRTATRAEDERPRLASFAAVAPVQSSTQPPRPAPVAPPPVRLSDSGAPSYPQVAQAVPPAQSNGRSAADVPDAEQPADTHGQVMDYLLSLSQDDLRKLRAEYRARWREQRKARSSTDRPTSRR